MSALGEGLGELLGPRSILFLYSQLSAEKYPMPCLKQWAWVLFLPPSDVPVRSFICHFHFSEHLPKALVNETAFGPRGESSPPETMDPAPRLAISCRRQPARPSWVPQGGRPLFSYNTEPAPGRAADAPAPHTDTERPRAAPCTGISSGGLPGPGAERTAPIPALPFSSSLAS